tara:strand:- start:9430 stop:9840 length:411 start_codon:yes stop_codon:yes gene_type:complete
VLGGFFIGQGPELLEHMHHVPEQYCIHTLRTIVRVAVLWTTACAGAIARQPLRVLLHLLRYKRAAAVEDTARVLELHRAIVVWHSARRHGGSCHVGLIGGALGAELGRAHSVDKTGDGHCDSSLRRACGVLGVFLF